MGKTFIRIVLLIFIISSFCFAGITGKIAGIAVDSKNGEPLPGVNIVIEGTFMGASTDENGFYAILNIPPGVYKVQALYMGYSTMEVSEVKVSADLTTNIDFSMMETTLEISETINVIADRPMIKRDEVSTRHYITSEEIELQPIDSFQEIAKNQAGVVGNHFRGGRTGEVMVIIDGIPVRDQAGEYSGDLGGFTSDVPEYAIEEMDVTLGGFSAEYGNVQSGILNLALKEGTRNVSGRFRIIHNPEFGSSKSFTENDFTFNQLQPIITTYELNLNGPLFLKNLSFSLSGEITDKDQGYYMNQESFDQSVQGKFTYKFSPQHKLSIGGLYNKVEWEQFYFPASKYGPGSNYQTDVYEAGVPANSDTLYIYRYVDNENLYGTTEYVNQPGSVTASGDTFNVVNTRYSAGMQEYLWDRIQTSNMIYLVWSHTLNSKSFYEVRLNNYYSNYHYATPDVEDRDGDGDRDEDLQWDVAKEGPHPIYREREDNYWWILGDDPGYRDQRSWTHSLKADYVNQFNANNLLKAGIQFDYHRTEVENISWTLTVGTYRKDIWDEDSFDFSAYVQDKLEFESIVVLAGLRYDMFNPNGLSDAIYYPADYYYPYSEFDDNGVPIINNPKKAEVKHQFSPRIGISHPITSESILHFNYGHYFQRPDAYYLYRNYQMISFTAVNNLVGYPNLEPEKTVAYEIGAEQQIGDEYKATLTGYYKDVTNLMNYEKLVGRSINNEIRLYTNADYGNIKGLEFTLAKNIGRFFGGKINYTYSIAKGRSSTASGGSGTFTDVKKMNLLDYDQRHTVNANLTFRTPKEFGTQFGGFYPFANWTANMQFDFGSGLPYSTAGTNLVNDQRKPWTSRTDIRIMRSLRFFDKYGVDIFMDIYNLFDRRNLSYISDAAYYDSDDPTINSDPTVIRRDIDGSYVRNSQAYSSGRRIRFGLGIHF